MLFVEELSENKIWLKRSKVNFSQIVIASVLALKWGEKITLQERDAKNGC